MLWNSKPMEPMDRVVDAGMTYTKNPGVAWCGPKFHGSYTTGYYYWYVQWRLYISWLYTNFYICICIILIFIFIFILYYIIFIFIFRFIFRFILYIWDGDYPLWSWDSWNLGGQWFYHAHLADVGMNWSVSWHGLGGDWTTNKDTLW